jgi:hypothetical protein
LVDANGDTAITLHCGDIVSIHGQTGEVFAGTREILGVQAPAPVGPEDGNSHSGVCAK